MNTIQNQNLSFASKFPLVNRGVPVERFEQLVRRYNKNEYLNILGNHYDVKGVVVQHPYLSGIFTLELSCLEESKKKTKLGRLVENIIGTRIIFQEFFKRAFDEATDLLDTDIDTFCYSSSDKHPECYIFNAYESSRPIRECIVNALKERARNPKCDPEQKTKAAQVCDRIEDWTQRKKNKLYNKTLKNLKEYYGDDRRIDLIINYVGENKGFDTDI